MAYNNDNNVERILQDDAREKRRAASGAFHNSGKRGGGTKGVKGVKTTVDWLKANDKKAYKAYIKGSEVKVYNVYENLKNVPQLSEILKKDEEGIRNTVTAIRNYHTNSVLRTHWGMSWGKILKNVIHKYNIPDAPKNKPTSRVRKTDENKDANGIEKYPQLEEVMLMEFSKGKETVERMIRLFTPKQVSKYWGISDFTLYNKVYSKFDIPRARSKRKGQVKEEVENMNQPIHNENENLSEELEKDNVIEHIQEQPVIQTQPVVQVQQVQIMQPVPQAEFEGFKIMLSGDYTQEQANKRISGMLMTLEDNRRYNIKVVIEELAE